MKKNPVINVIIRNKKTGVDQQVSLKAYESILQDHKLAKSIQLIGKADEKGQLIPNSLKDLDRAIKVKPATKFVNPKPIEEIGKNQMLTTQRGPKDVKNAKDKEDEMD